MARKEVALPAEAELAQRYAEMKTVCCRFVAAYRKGKGTVSQEEMDQIYRMATDVVGENVKSWWWMDSMQERSDA